MSDEVIQYVQRLSNDVIIAEWKSLNVTTKVQLFLDDYATLVWCEMVRRKLDVTPYLPANIRSEAQFRVGVGL